MREKTNKQYIDPDYVQQLETQTVYFGTHLCPKCGYDGLDIHDSDADVNVDGSDLECSSEIIIPVACPECNWKGEFQMGLYLADVWEGHYGDTVVNREKEFDFQHPQSTVNPYRTTRLRAEKMDAERKAKMEAGE